MRRQAREAIAHQYLWHGAQLGRPTPWAEADRLGFGVLPTTFRGEVESTKEGTVRGTHGEEEVLLRRVAARHLLARLAWAGGRP